MSSAPSLLPPNQLWSTKVATINGPSLLPLPSTSLSRSLTHTHTHNENYLAHPLSNQPNKHWVPYVGQLCILPLSLIQVIENYSLKPCQENTLKKPCIIEWWGKFDHIP